MANRWLSMEPINSATVSKWMRGLLSRTEGNEERKHESFPAVYSPAGCHVAADGRYSSCRGHRLQATTGFRSSRSRLPNNPDCDVLPRRKPGSDDVVRYCASRAA